VCIVQRADCHTNAIKERELNLRGFKIPLIENLAALQVINILIINVLDFNYIFFSFLCVIFLCELLLCFALQDQVETIDLSDNDLKIVENFPKMNKLTCLLLMSNSISSISGSSSLTSNLGNLTSLILSNNNISQLTEVYNIAGFKKLEILSLLENPVSLMANYRNYVIVKVPSLKTLDFVKVKKQEREEARAWAKSQAGRACIAQVQADAITKNAAAGGGSGGQSGSGSLAVVAAPSLVSKAVAAPVKRVYSDSEKVQIRSAIESATSPEEMDQIERQLKVSMLRCMPFLSALFLIVSCCYLFVVFRMEPFNSIIRQQMAWAASGSLRRRVVMVPHSCYYTVIYIARFSLYNIILLLTN